MLAVQTVVCGNITGNRSKTIEGVLKGISCNTTVNSSANTNRASFITIHFHVQAIQDAQESQLLLVCLP